MRGRTADKQILEHMIEYCNQIEGTVERFGQSLEVFQTDFVYQNAVAMCILQIGELAGKLTDDFKAEYNKMPWRNIKDMRNIMAHHYGRISVLTTWETVQTDIPALKAYCIESAEKL